MRTEDGLRVAHTIAEKVAAGALSREQAERELHEQFPEDCPHCQERYDETLALLYAPPPAGIVNRRRFAARMQESLAPRPVKGQPNPKKRRRLVPPAVLRERSRAAFAKLHESGSWYVRRERVRLEWYRFCGVEVARWMLTEALAALPAKPEDSGEWAGLVLMVLAGERHKEPEGGEAVLLRLRARLLQANAARCRGDLDLAAEEMAFTLRSASDFDIRDLPFWVEAKRFLAPLGRDRREFPAAAQEARAWAALARAAQLPVAEIQARWSLASIYEQQGAFGSALTAVRRAVPLFVEVHDPVLEMGVRHSEVSLLTRSRHFTEAERAYLALVPLYDQLPDRENFRFWVLALISAGLDRPAEAEDAFRASREGFLTEKNPYDAALVTLDWSLYLLDQGRAEEVLPLAVSMGQAFEALGVARETMASWAIFQAAAQRRELDRAVAKGLVEQLGNGRAAARK